MPVIGWFSGRRIEPYIESFDHWVAFVLLFIVGGKMTKSYTDHQKECSLNPSKGWVLVMLSIATSIDALAVALSLAFVGSGIWYPAVTAGDLKMDKSISLFIPISFF